MPRIHFEFRTTGGYLFILHSGAQQVIERSASAEPHFSTAKKPGIPAATPAHLYYQTTIEAIE